MTATGPVVEVGLIRGPFKHLKNRWEFHPDPAGTRLEFMIDFAFRSRLLDGMLHANFDRAVGSLIRCFETGRRGVLRKALRWPMTASTSTRPSWGQGRSVWPAGGR